MGKHWKRKKKKTIEKHGEKQVGTIQSLDFTGSRINKFKSIADGFPHILLNNEAQKELDFIVRVEQEFKRDYLSYRTGDTKANSDLWKGNITLEEAVKGQEDLVGGTNNSDSSTKPRKRNNRKKSYSQIIA